MGRFIVELEPGVYLAPWSGDPGRTLVQQNAKRYETEKKARYALRAARGLLREFRHARIIPLDTDPPCA